jgi:acetyl-CoA carboxylase biotin carboxylase subunit
MFAGQKANVPCVPGSDGLILTEKDAMDVVERVGFPIMIKATAGEGVEGAHV